MSGLMLVLFVIAGLLALFLVGWGLFWFLVQAGLIVRAAATPPTTDTKDYSMSQGREVKSEDQ